MSPIVTGISVSGTINFAIITAAGALIRLAAIRCFASAPNDT